MRADYGLFTNVPRIIAPYDFSPSLFKLRKEEVSYLS